MKKLSKTIIIYPLLILVALSAGFSLTVDYSFAAESFDVSHSTRWVQGENIDSGLRIKTKGGTVAYCLNQGSASPTGTYTDSLSLTTKLKAVLYHGYPNNKKFGSTELTADQARCATQLAVWGHDTSGKGKKIDLSKLHGAEDHKPHGDNVLKAAKWIYNKAASGYTAPKKPTLKAPKISKPADDTPQFFNENYVRVGPYKFTTTKNSYTSGHKVNVDLSGAPSGTVIGNVYGTFINVPTANEDFYIYLPSASLGAPGSSYFKMSVSYNYKYEKAASFSAYKKDSTQNVAISTKKSYASGTKNTEVTNPFVWTNAKITKVDANNKNKPISDTEFKIYYDPTPENPGNNDWVFMYNKTTDKYGVINVPGLGRGTYKLVETKSNPNYALNSEFGGSDERVFSITDVSTQSLQVMTNKLISVSCQVDKDTIKKTSAAYKSLPDQEGIDNVNNETYRYHVNYRSTANSWADEYVVDDPLEGVSQDQIRVTELWTPVSHGDYDKKMNVWYKTNKTDDGTDYSNIEATKGNPQNPNNPGKTATKKNTGFKLWEKDVSTTKRTHLKVENLGLSDDEYITAIRLEHGRVERGFTTKNHASDSVNNDEQVDWQPEKNHQYYTDGSKNAQGLKPLTYLVKCPNPLSPPEVIENSAKSYISRNLHLNDNDEDKVFTEVVDTFKENPINEDYPTDEEKPKTPDKKLEKEEVEKKGPNTKVTESKVSLTNAKTSDKFFLIALIILLLGSLTGIILLYKKSRTKMLPAILIAALLTGMVGFSSQSFASGGHDESAEKTTVKASSRFNGKITKKANSNFTVNNIEYSLVDAKLVGVKAAGNKSVKDKTVYNVEYIVDETLSASQFDSTDLSSIIPSTTNVNVSGFKGLITLKDKIITPKYIKKQQQIDKKETLKDLDIEDITNLPKSKKYTVRSDDSPTATEEKDLKRAGISLKVVGYDDDGVPNHWDATIVYRGLEKYLEPYKYNVVGNYTGQVSAKKTVIETSGSKSPKRKVASADNSQTTPEEWLEENGEKIAKEQYYKSLGYEIPKDATVKEMDDIVTQDEKASGMKTSDIMKSILLLVILAAISFVAYVFFSRKKQNTMRDR